MLTAQPIENRPGMLAYKTGQQWVGATLRFSHDI